MKRHLGVGTFLLGLVFSTTCAEAAEMRSGDQVLIPSGVTINDDLYVAGGHVTINGRVTGDLYAMGGTVTVSGPVDGDIVVAGGTLRVEGPAGHSVRAAGGDVTAAGVVAKDLLAYGGSLKTAPTLRVGGQSYIGGGNVLADGQLGRSLDARAGTLQLDGQVQGPANLLAPTLQVGRNARIEGDASLATATRNPVASGAVIQGQVITNPLEQPRQGLGLAGWVLGFLMALTVGLTLLWMVPRRADETSAVAMHAPGWRMLAGLLALILAPLAAALMMVTVIGIPLGVLLLVTYGVALYLAQLVVAWSAGRSLFNWRHLAMDSYGKRAAALALGLFVVYLARAIPVLGPLVSLVVLVWGLGTLGTIAYQWLRSRRAHGARGPASA